jgi:type IV pilus assembly protein PilN
MININLLPHREMRRERRKKDFIGLASVTAIAAGGVAFLAITTISQMISSQEERNAFIKKENAALEKQITEIATLQSEIDSLKARQGAVENLQADRTLPVHLLDELVKRIPEGIQLREIKQEELKVTFTGLAQSQDRVSEAIRQLAYQTPWLEKPELGEIKAVTLAGEKGKEKEAKGAFEFRLVAFLKRPGKPDDKDEKAQPKDGQKPAAKATTAAVDTGKKTN